LKANFVGEDIHRRAAVQQPDDFYPPVAVVESEWEAWQAVEFILRWIESGDRLR